MLQLSLTTVIANVTMLIKDSKFHWSSLYLLLATCIFCCIYTRPVEATSSEPIDDFFALSLEDLINVEIDIASKKIPPYGSNQAQSL